MCGSVEVETESLMSTIIRAVGFQSGLPPKKALRAYALSARVGNLLALAGYLDGARDDLATQNRQAVNHCLGNQGPVVLVKGVAHAIVV